MIYYDQSVTQVIKELQTDPTTGLSRSEAAKRLSKYGPNLLPTRDKPPMIYKFFAQFKSILVLILLSATVVSLFLGDKLDAIAIFAIVILNATIGFIQEIQAEKTLESLKDKDILFTLVLRENQIEKIAAGDIVPGDILILEEGAKVPADARIIEAYCLQVDESILTGESKPVTKNPAELTQKNIPLADRVNFLFKATQIISGRAKAIVTATGKDTEIGKIALFLEKTPEVKSPLTIELDRVGKSLTLVIGIIAAVVFFLNTAAKVPLVDSLLVSISLAVAAIPEGLPTIVTIILSLGVRRLALKKTVVKNLPAVETLGAVRIIATDKTGTLTQNKINVVKIITASHQEYTIEGEGYLPEGIFFDKNKKIVDVQNQSELLQLLKAGALANNATIKSSSWETQSEAWRTPESDSGHLPADATHQALQAGARMAEILGDTTEGALLVAATRANINMEELKLAEKRIFEVPFSSERKMMSVIAKIDDTKDYFLYAKGAPEVILPKCLNCRPGLEVAALKMAAYGLRSLAIAFKKLNKNEVKKALEENILYEEGLTFLGIVGMQDPLREEIVETILQAKAAGIRTIMITGDHKETAASIARQAGISQKGDIVLTENDLNKFTDEELIKEIKNGVSVFARISPFAKLRIVEAIKQIPNTQVAVTGDGVNDAPALTAAHIGIAMGHTGTDVAREVADMVVTDDNFATIVEAVREGRVIYANLVKFIRYLISCNLSEVIVIAGGVLLSTPLPLLPIQILWINLITDGLPALALGVDPPEHDVMGRPPRNLTEGILHKKRWAYMIVEGSIMGGAALLLFVYALNRFSYQTAQTMVFVTLAFSQLVHAFNNRSSRISLFKLGIFTNKYLVVTAIFSIVLQIMVVQTDWGNILFKTTILNTNNWLLVTLVSLLPFFVVEAKKQLRFRILP